MRTLSLVALTCLSACDDAEPGGPAALVGSDAVVEDADMGTRQVDAAREDPDPPTPNNQDRWVAIIDVTEGVGIAGYFGTDVDAVTYSCPSGSGVGTAVDDDQRLPPGDRYPAAGAIGAPDGPCDPIEACAAPLGGGGSLLVRVASGDLAGCTVTVHEVAPSVTQEPWGTPLVDWS